MSAATAESASLDDAQRIPASGNLLRSFLRHVAFYLFMIERAGEWGSGEWSKVASRNPVYQLASIHPR
jgi:hypothetical protein